MSEISRKDFLGLGTMATAGLAAGCAPASASGGLTPDLIVVNGNVLTQDDANPTAEAFAIKDGSFVAVGTKSATLSTRCSRSHCRAATTGVMTSSSRALKPRASNFSSRAMRGREVVLVTNK